MPRLRREREKPGTTTLYVTKVSDYIGAVDLVPYVSVSFIPKR
jgi:hypothetical protein